MILLSGVINGTAPNPVRLGEMCEQLGSAMGRPSWLPVPELALKAVLGEGASVVRNLLIISVIFPLGFVFTFCELFFTFCWDLTPAGSGRTKGASYQS